MALAFLGTMLSCLPVAYANSSEGYHKQLFVNCGRHLLCPTPHAAKHLDLSYEILRPRSTTDQNRHIQSSPTDQNGVLLYPDGAPRYQAIYVNGGESKDHGKTLGKVGLKRFRDFFLQGGSYTGSCAGAFIASSRRMGKDMGDLYFSIWPGETRETWFNDKASSWYIGPTGFNIAKDSPLLKYSDFGGDLYVDAIKHYEGPYALEEEHWPAETEVLARFDLPKSRFHKTPSIWAYQNKQGSGRMVVVASHPENYRSGERRDLMASILSYAIDGRAEPTLKAALTPQTILDMGLGTEDKEPCRTKIGDGQIHHFALQVPKGTETLRLDLEGDKELSSGESANLDLFAQPLSAAWPSKAAHKATQPGATESVQIENPEPGLWFVSVRGSSYVNALKDSDASAYSKNLGALNGIAYRLGMRLDDGSKASKVQDKAHPWCGRPLSAIKKGPEPEEDGDDKDDGNEDKKSPDPQDPSQDSNSEPKSDESPSPDPKQDSGRESGENPKTSPKENSSAPADDDLSKEGCNLQRDSSPWASAGLLLFLATFRRPSVRWSLRKVPAPKKLRRN